MNISLNKLLEQIGLRRVKHQIINDFYETIGIMTKEDIFIPCEPSAINKTIDKKVKAILIVHYFGHAQNI